MASFNKVILMGNLTRDPELRYLPSGSAVCDFTIATNRQYKTREGEQKEEVAFIDTSMFGRRGEVISEYLKKGDPILVEGRLKLDQWETAEGRRSKLKVIAESFEFVGSSRGGYGDSNSGSSGYSQPSGQRSQSAQRQRPQQQAPAPPPEDIGDDVSDDEIPF